MKEIRPYKQGHKRKEPEHRCNYVVQFSCVCVCTLYFLSWWKGLRQLIGGVLNLI